MTSEHKARVAVRILLGKAGRNFLPHLATRVGHAEGGVLVGH